MIDWRSLAVGAVTVGASVCGAVWFAGHRDAVIDDHEKRITKLEVVGEKIGTYDVQLARIEEQLKFVNETLVRIAGTTKK